ncbi:MAG: prephenate dehydratase domain-containing protein [Pyrinomonadaceae bacterium]
MSKEKISDPRAEIDAIDGELLRLLNRRAEIALRVGAAKSSNETSLCDTNREREVLARLRQENTGPFDEHGINNIFQKIIDESLLLQQKTFYKLGDAGQAESGVTRLTGRSRVAFLGDRGTFSEEAALGIMGDECEAVSFPTFDDLFKAVETGKADYILAPLENTLIGSVHQSVELLLASSLTIVADIILPISHFLVACPEATLDTVQTIESHPAALAQCRRFFAAYPHLKAVPTDDTAGGVRRAVQSGDPTRAGIGGQRTAEIYGGKILREHLEDDSENYTRFALLSSEAELKTTGSKLSLLIQLKNHPGALHDALSPFVRRGINLLKIESLPILGKPGQFNFYIDLQTPAIENELERALEEIREQAESVRHLGRYSTTNLTAGNQQQ